MDDGTPAATSQLPTSLLFAGIATSVCGTRSVADAPGTGNRVGATVAVSGAAPLTRAVKAGSCRGASHGTARKPACPERWRTHRPGAEHRRQANTGSQRPSSKAGAHCAAAAAQSDSAGRHERASAAPTPDTSRGAAQDAQSVNLPSTSVISSPSTTERFEVARVAGYRSPALVPPGEHALHLPFALSRAAQASAPSCSSILWAWDRPATNAALAT